MTSEGAIEKRNRRRPKTIIIAVSAILIVVYCSVAISSIPTFRAMFEARKVFKAYNEALIAKDYAMAYNLLAPETKANVSYEKFVDIQNKVGNRAGQFLSYSTSETDTKGEEGQRFTTIEAYLKYAKGNLQFEYVLKEERGVWFVYSFQEL
jgi:hypothetical protein